MRWMYIIGCFIGIGAVCAFLIVLWKNQKNEPARIPAPILELSSRLSVGQMIPVRTQKTAGDSSSACISFVIKEDDELLSWLQSRREPLIETSYGVVCFHFERKIFVLFLLVRIEGEAGMTYETGFSLADPNIRNDFQTLVFQDGLQIILCGQEKRRVLDVKTSENFRRSLKGAMNMIKRESDLDWSMDEYMACSNAIKSKTKNQDELWEILREANGFLETRRGTTPT